MKLGVDSLTLATKLLFSAMVIAWFLVLPPATCAQCAPDIENRSQVLEIDGAEGTWFHRDVLVCMLIDLEELQLVRVRIVLLEDRILRRDSQFADLREATLLGTQALVESNQVIDSVTRRAVEAEDTTDLWHWLSFLWGGLGIAIGVTVSVLVAGAL